MIHLRSSGAVPKSYRNTTLHTIVTRHTLLGFHRTRKESSLDSDCSKTLLLVTSDMRLVELMKEQLDNEHKYGYTWNRNIVNDTISREKEPVKSLMPLSIMSLPIDDFEKLCWLHNFDMFVASSYEMRKDVMYLNGYDYKTWEPPNRGIVEKYMTDMLYKNI